MGKQKRYTVGGMRKQIIMVRRLLVVSIAMSALLVGNVALAADKTADKKTETKTPTNLSSAVPQSYNAGPEVQPGMIVRLKEKDPTTVEPLKSDAITEMLGIVIPTDNAAIVLAPEKAAKQQVLVATSGHYSVLVSNQNGGIKSGDFITISAVSGIGMKASDNELEVLGRASGNFSGTANVIGSVKIKNSIGGEREVSIGRVPIDMSISHNPLFQKSADYVPGFLAKVAVSIADKPVSVARIYLSMAILFVISIITGNMLYSGIRSGMIAVGRNPLSKKSIIKSLIQTVIAGLIIFIVGLFGVYLLLKL